MKAAYFLRRMFVFLCAGSTFLFVTQQYKDQSKQAAPEEMRELASLFIHKLKDVVPIQEGKHVGTGVDMTQLKHVRIWIDVPIDFPWRKCVLDYNGVAATDGCNLNKDPGQTWIIAPSNPSTPSYRIMTTAHSRCLEPEDPTLVGKGTNLKVKECSAGSWKHLSSGHLEWSGGGCATALGMDSRNKMSLSPCDEDSGAQRFEFGFFDEEKVEISPLDMEDWEQRQNSLREKELKLSLAEFKLRMKEVEEEEDSIKPTNMSRRAAVFYLDAGSDTAYVRWWLLAWRLLGLNSEEERFDLVLFVHPTMANRLPSGCSEYKDGVTQLQGGKGQCLFVPLEGIAERDPNHYDKYINSDECLVSPKSHFLRQYSHILRSDLDTFPAPALVGNRPDMIIANKFMSYDFRNSSGESKITEGLENAMIYLGQKHKGWHDTGSTWYGPSHRILKMAKLAVASFRFLRVYMFGPGTFCRCATCVKLPKECQWGGGPYAGTLQMYAQEIAINLVWTQAEYDAMKGWILDMGTSSVESVCPRIQLHVYHSENDFSKFKFKLKAYKTFDMAHLDPTKIRDYAIYLALKSSSQGYNVEVVDQKFSLGADGSLAKICQNGFQPVTLPPKSENIENSIDTGAPSLKEQQQFLHESCSDLTRKEKYRRICKKY